MKFRSWVAVAMVSSLGFGCGGGGSTSGTATSGSATTEVINGITVPVAPEVSANAATLKGVDSNNNGVRDDVERFIAGKVKGQSDFLLTIDMAKNLNQLAVATSAMTSKEVTGLISSIGCTGLKYYQNNSNVDIEPQIRAATFNTTERKNAALLALQNSSATIGGSDECQ